MVNFVNFDILNNNTLLGIIENTMIFANAYEAIENDFYQEMELNLNDILGSNVLEDEKYKLLNSLLDIFRRRFKETPINFQMQNNVNSNTPNNYERSDKPFINLVFTTR